MAHVHIPWHRLATVVLLVVLIPIVLMVAVTLVFYRLHPWISAPH